MVENKRICFRLIDNAFMLERLAVVHYLSNSITCVYYQPKRYIIILLMNGTSDLQVHVNGAPRLTKVPTERLEQADFGKFVGMGVKDTFFGFSYMRSCNC